MEQGYKQAKEQIAQLEAEFAEFQAFSKELERELELELAESENKHKELQNKVDSLSLQVSEWKQKHLELSKEYAATQASLQKQVLTLQKAHTMANNRLREIEMTNDDMERHERITKSSLYELEKKYHQCLEDIAMLESEVAAKDDLQVEVQRAKDELRDTKEELSVANNKIKHLERDADEVRDKVSLSRSPTILRTQRFRITSDPSAAMSNVTVSASPSGSPHTSPLVGSNMPRMASSKSLRKIHGMLDQMRNLETRVAHFKSSLPIPATPTKSASSSSVSSTVSSASPRPKSGLGQQQPRRSEYSPPSLKLIQPLSSSQARKNSSISYLDKALNEKTEYRPKSATERSRSATERSRSAIEARTSMIASASARRREHPREMQNPHHQAEEFLLRRPPRTKLGLEPIEGSPTAHVKSRSPLLIRKKVSSSSATSEKYDEVSEKLPRRVEPKSSMEKTNGAGRPGSAFSALNSRSGIGHGRFV